MIKINDQKSRLHLVACNQNQRIALHFTSFHVTFHVISCYISCHFILHCTHFIVRIACIVHISRMSRISHFTHIANFMHCITLHVIEISRSHFMPFHVAFHVISCCILRYFTSHFTHFIVRIACIACISCMSRISHCTHIAHFTHCTSLHVILCIILYHFIMKIYFILIHDILH